ncbi:MAG: hypothetical protein LBI96_06935 [Odoribacteraceae bacterium]|jgi:hypothetical protein|nr:hypothetical protein [Odoribacteraceae bacterium]
MTTVIIKEDSPQARQFVEYARTLPFVTVIEEKMSFAQAAEERGAVDVDTFFDELDQRIKRAFQA